MMPQFIETVLYWLGELHCKRRHKEQIKFGRLTICKTCHRIKGNS